MSYLDDPELLERLRAGFRATPLHALLGLEYLDETTDPAGPGDPVGSAADGWAVVSMPVREEAYGTTGSLHGGAIATLLDVVCASAAARASGFEPGVNSLVTADLHVRYLGRPHGDVVYGRARVLKAGKQLVVVDGRVTDGEGRTIAAADFSSMLVPRRGPLPGVTPVEPLGPET